MYALIVKLALFLVALGALAWQLPLTDAHPRRSGSEFSTGHFLPPFPPIGTGPMLRLLSDEDLEFRRGQQRIKQKPCGPGAGSCSAAIFAA